MSTYKRKFNKKYGFKPNEDHSLQDIAKITNYKLGGIKTIYNKGLGAFFSNPQSVRPLVKRQGGSKRWAFARVYAAIDPRSKAHKIDKIHLKK